MHPNKGDFIAGPAGRVFCLAFPPDSKRFAAGDDSGQVWIWEAITGNLLTRFSVGDPIQRWWSMVAALMVWAAVKVYLRCFRGGD